MLKYCLSVKYLFFICNTVKEVKENQNKDFLAVNIRVSNKNEGTFAK